MNTYLKRLGYQGVVLNIYISFNGNIFDILILFELIIALRNFSYFLNLFKVCFVKIFNLVKKIENVMQGSLMEV